MYHHPSCCVSGTTDFHVHCEEQLQYKAEVCRLQMFLREALPTVIIPHTCITEYSDGRTTPYHDCCPTGCTATNPPTSYYHLYNNCATSTSWFHTHCCLCAVSVSTTKEEKFPEQCKVLWMCVYFIVTAATIGLILALLILYELMLLVQVQIGTGVFSLSLLPSFPLSALGMVLEEEIPEEEEFQKEIRGGGVVIA